MKNLKIKKFICILMSAVMCFCLSACGDELTDRKVRKILKNSGYNYENVSIARTLNLKKGTPGLKGVDNKLILMKTDKCYNFAIVNAKKKTIIMPEVGYNPLRVVIQDILGKEERFNKKNLTVAKKYIEKYGIEGLTDIDHAEEYFRDITRANGIGIIEKEAAQALISDEAPSWVGNDVTVIYEDDSAVPLGYASGTSEMTYNWGSIWPEYQYDFVRNSLDRSTLSTITKMYGPAYSMKTIYYVSDRNMKGMGKYKSLDEAKKNLLSEKSK